MKQKKVVVIGGGTGTYTTLLALNTLPVSTTAIVSMADSGGSNRIIRDEFGLLPTSDIRQAIVALSSSNANHLLRQLFTYRYNHGTGITGMSFGNLFMAALTDIFGNQEKAIRATCRLLKVKGKIIPITFDNSHLLAKYTNGKQVLGEHYIDEPEPNQAKYRIHTLEMVPDAHANPKAVKAIKNADYIIFPPGDLYTSLICNLLVKNIVPVIQQSKAQKIYFVNLMTRFGQTNKFTVKNHITELEKYLGKNITNFILINNKQKLPDEIVGKYKEEQAKLVNDDLKGKSTYHNAKLIRADLISDLITKKQKSDILQRSLIRHDPDKTASILAKIMVK